MLSECCECDRPALRYWGMHAYCRWCLGEVMLEQPRAHSCSKCLSPQPGNVAWEGRACGTCIERERRTP